MKADNGRRKGDELVTALYPIRSRAIISEITDKFRRSQVFLQDIYDFRISWNLFLKIWFYDGDGIAHRAN
jgi:hypothetical protein